MAEEGYTIKPARYAKGMTAVFCIKNGLGTKTRAMRLLSSHLNARWSNRERAYITTPSKVKKFEQLFADGRDACVVSGELYDPNKEPAQ